MGEATIVRDHPGTLVVEETHFPVWLWWPCLSALWVGMAAIGGLTWSGILVLVAAYAVMVLPLLLAVSLQGYQRLSIRDGEAVVVTRVQHVGRSKAKRFPLDGIDFVSCEKQVTFASPGDAGAEDLIVTVHLKDGPAETVMKVPYCKTVVAALEKHLPGILACDAGDGHPPAHSS